jgi:large subunit ribosomal protein L30
MAKLKITQIKSTIRQPYKQKRTMEALGLRRMGHTNTIEDSPQVRGMVKKVSHLISVEEA